MIRLKTSAMGGFQSGRALPRSGGGTAIRENVSRFGRALQGGLVSWPPCLVRGADYQTGEAHCLESAQGNDPAVLEVEAQ